MPLYTRWRTMSLFSPFSSAICNCTAVMNLSPTVMPPCVFFLCRIGCVIALSTLHTWAIRWRTRLSGMSLSFAVWRCALVSFIATTLQFDEFLDVKFTLVQILQRLSLILKARNVFHHVESVCAFQLFRWQLQFCKADYVHPAFVVMFRFVNIVTQSQTPPGWVYQAHQQCVSTLRDSDNVCHS